MGVGAHSRAQLYMEELFLTHSRNCFYWSYTSDGALDELRMN